MVLIPSPPGHLLLRQRSAGHRCLQISVAISTDMVSVPPPGPTDMCREEQPSPPASPELSPELQPLPTSPTPYGSLVPHLQVAEQHKS